MSTREAIINEIKTAPESLVREAYDFVMYLKQRRAPHREPQAPGSAATRTDFLARQRAMFGDRVLTDSEPILDELRSDRF